MPGLLSFGLPVLLLVLYHTASFGLSSLGGWSEEAAKALVGENVKCISNPDGRFLGWGPRFKGLNDRAQPKAIGVSVKVGATGRVTKIFKVSKGVYKVVVHWDSERNPNVYTASVVGPEEYHQFISGK